MKEPHYRVKRSSVEKLPATLQERIEYDESDGEQVGKLNEINASVFDLLMFWLEKDEDPPDDVWQEVEAETLIRLWCFAAFHGLPDLQNYAMHQFLDKCENGDLRPADVQLAFQEAQHGSKLLEAVTHHAILILPTDGWTEEEKDALGDVPRFGSMIGQHMYYHYCVYDQNRDLYMVRYRGEQAADM